MMRRHPKRSWLAMSKNATPPGPHSASALQGKLHLPAENGSDL